MAQFPHRTLLLIVLIPSLVSCDLVTKPNNKNKQSSPSQTVQQQPSNGAVPSSSGGYRKPNIVLILTDDQDVELGSLTFMPKTLKMIRDQGAEFRHAYVTTPMCCPSRSSLLTGMYMHNHHVYTNNDNCSSTQWQATYETRSFATYLSNAGYRTGYFGKYLNKYNGSYIPPGWREWGGLIMNSKYYNYSINMNGKKIKHGADYQKDYYSDLIANDSIAFLRQSKKNNQHKPVMLTMSFPAPHGPEDSAPQYSHLFFNVTTHHTPSYDFAPNPDKQWILQITKKMEPIHRQFTDLLMTKRLQTLQSVDDAVQRVVQELDSLGELHNTYIIYTSDHGYHLGQFGLIKGKSFPFEFDVRVPFLVRGPGVEAGSVVDDIVLNIDLAPTFLHMAGVEQPSHMDGRSVLPLFLNSKRNKRPKWPDTFLIESSGRRETPYLDAKMRNKLLNKDVTTQMPFSGSTKGFWENFTSTATYSSTIGPKVYESGEEVTLRTPDEDDLDDLITDDDETDELESRFDIDENSARYFEDNNSNVEIEASKDLLKVPDMQLDNQLLPLPVTKLERLTIECAHENMMFPCKVGQKWFCQNINGRMRKHKCKSNFNPYTAVNVEKPYKKCACFTPNGVVYKKIPLQTVKKRDLFRVKRDVELDEILFKRLNEEKFKRMSRREKRDTLEHVDTVMRSVHRQMSNIRKPTSLETNRILDGIPGCMMQNGSVNCMHLNKKTWRQSRLQIENEIQALKHKLETLKEIRKQLKQSKPSDVESSENTDEVDDEDEESDEEEDDIGMNGNQSDVKFVHKHPEVTTEGARLNFTENVFGQNLNNFTDFTDVSTRSPSSTVHTNPHRHGHRILDSTVGTTRGYNEEVTFENVRRRTTSIPPRIKQEDVIAQQNKTNICHCNEPPPPTNHLIAAQEEKRRLKQERLRKKLRRQRRKDQLERECGMERMNCFHHDNDHWRTAPLWTAGPFCFCMNANNNTYSCIRTINSTHNFLYCEFTTGLVTFYNLRMDPFELHNGIDQLKPEEKSYLHDLLEHLMACKGRSCTINHHHHQQHNSKHRTVLQLHDTMNNQSKLKKRKFGDDFGGRGVDERHGFRQQQVFPSKVGMSGKNRNHTLNNNKYGFADIRTRRKTNQ